MGGARRPISYHRSGGRQDSGLHGSQPPFATSLSSPYNCKTGKFILPPLLKYNPPARQEVKALESLKQFITASKVVISPNTSNDGESLSVILDDLIERDTFIPRRLRSLPPQYSLDRSDEFNYNCSQTRRPSRHHSSHTGKAGEDQVVTHHGVAYRKDLPHKRHTSTSYGRHNRLGNTIGGGRHLCHTNRNKKVQQSTRGGFRSSEGAVAYGSPSHCTIPNASKATLILLAIKTYQLRIVSERLAQKEEESRQLGALVSELSIPRKDIAVNSGHRNPNGLKETKLVNGESNYTENNCSSRFKSSCNRGCSKTRSSSRDRPQFPSVTCSRHTSASNPISTAPSNPFTEKEPNYPFSPFEPANGDSKYDEETTASAAAGPGVVSVHRRNRGAATPTAESAVSGEADKDAVLEIRNAIGMLQQRLTRLHEGVVRMPSVGYSVSSQSESIGPDSRTVSQYGEKRFPTDDSASRRGVTRKVRNGVLTTSGEKTQSNNRSNKKKSANRQFMCEEKFTVGSLASSSKSGMLAEGSVTSSDVCDLPSAKNDPQCLDGAAAKYSVPVRVVNFGKQSRADHSSSGFVEVLPLTALNVIAPEKYKGRKAVPFESNSLYSCPQTYTFGGSEEHQHMIRSATPKIEEVI